MATWADNEEIKIFQEYLQIPSVHPNVDYEPCIRFLRKQANALGLPIAVYYPSGDQTKPVAVLTWLGLEPSLPSVLLNSHMDVVPVFEPHWTHRPFGAEIDAQGRIFARGSQDMKCVGVQYLAAIRALKADGVHLRRTLHIVFVPDEETGGELGMRLFVDSVEFKALNVGFALDEGIASTNDVFSVYYAERSIWKVVLKCSGNAGHGSLLLKNTASEKVLSLMTKFAAYRAKEVERLDSSPALTIGDVTTVNLTIIKGGVQANVVPPDMTIIYDCRLAIDVVQDDFEEMLHRWCSEAGDGVELSYEQKDDYVTPTTIDGTNPFWVAFERVIVEDLQLKIKTQVFPGGTDSRYIRKAGIPAIGFSPIDKTPILLHDHDEYLRADTYLRGIDIYKALLPKLANA